MSIDDIINGALSHIAPVIPDYCDTVDEPVIVYNISSKGELYCDDYPVFDNYRIMLHLYAPMGTEIKSIIRKIKTSLVKAGFSYATIINASDNQSVHYVLETDICLDVSIDG